MSFHELRAACDEGRRRVTFEVEHSEEHGRVFLFGGCRSLGLWDPQEAQELTRNATCAGRWELDLVFRPDEMGRSIEYRYFVAHRCTSQRGEPFVASEDLIFDTIRTLRLTQSHEDHEVSVEETAWALVPQGDLQEEMASLRTKLEQMSRHQADVRDLRSNLQQLTEKHERLAQEHQKLTAEKEEVAQQKQRLQEAQMELKNDGQKQELRVWNVLRKRIDRLEKDFEAQQAPATPAAAEPCVEEVLELGMGGVLEVDHVSKEKIERLEKAFDQQQQFLMHVMSELEKMQKSLAFVRRELGPRRAWSSPRDEGRRDA
ncbi:unnamed protein product [Durusdinium trenchii]|uniref:Uncharacterized protein n=2 Tax=Durusdinium trenchii TaxID=1381693 RepID=A0ABP0L1A7_9DINO